MTRNVIDEWIINSSFWAVVVDHVRCGNAFGLGIKNSGKNRTKNLKNWLRRIVSWNSMCSNFPFSTLQKQKLSLNTFSLHFPFGKSFSLHYRRQYHFVTVSSLLGIQDWADMQQPGLLLSELLNGEFPGVIMCLWCWHISAAIKVDMMHIRKAA